jgi:hypothetical protein
MVKPNEGEAPAEGSELQADEPSEEPSAEPEPTEEPAAEPEAKEGSAVEPNPYAPNGPGE